MAIDGDAVCAVGAAVGTVGDDEGDLDGTSLGDLDGETDGIKLGDLEGALDGDPDGVLDGDTDGGRVGVVMSSESIYIELDAVNEIKARLRSAALSQDEGRSSRSPSNRVPEGNEPSYCFKTTQFGATNSEGPHE